MPLIVQHLLVFFLVGVCAAYTGWQMFRALAGKRSKLGSCCAKGCPPPAPPGKAQAPKVHFIASDQLRRRS